MQISEISLGKSPYKLYICSMKVFLQQPRNIIDKLDTIRASVARHKTPIISLLIRRTGYVLAFKYLDSVATRINIGGKSLWMWEDIRVTLEKVDYV